MKLLLGFISFLTIAACSPIGDEVVNGQQPLDLESIATDAEMLERGLQIYGIDNPNEKRLILYEIDHELKAEVITELDKFKFMEANVKFQDITQYWDQYIDVGDNGVFDIEALGDIKVKSDIYFHKYIYPNSTTFHKKEVNSLIEDIATTFIFEKLSNFTSFYSRYYKADTGVQSQLWLYEQIVSLIPEDYLKYTDITLFDHKSWDQKSIIVTIYGENTVKKDGKYVDKGPVVVLGAHQDSANAIFPKYLKAPGADDDGSGSITILETLRIIMAKKIKFVNTVEFHFYSAEEAGLLGSLDIFNSYREANVTVIAMLQQDMTGFVQKTIDAGIPEHLGVTTDYTSDILYDFVVQIIDTYCLIPARATKCGYACSDHSSALQNGYPSIMVIESEFKYTDPYIHSSSDTIDKLSVTHIAENVKMDLGYIYELGQWAHIEEEGAVLFMYRSGLTFKIHRFFYSHFDAICIGMAIWTTLVVLVFVMMLKDAGVKSKFVKFVMRRKYHFLNSV